MAFTNDTKIDSSFDNDTKTGATLNAYLLDIGDGFNLLIDSTYKLEIQSEVSGIAWNNDTKE